VVERFVSIQNSYVENLIINVMVLRGGGLWGQSYHEGGALVNEISALIGGPSEPHHVRTVRRHLL
jgi:hypothetical protein